MKLKTVAYTSALVGCLGGQAIAQEALEVFGYFQAFGVYTDDRGLLNKNRENLDLKNQQLNVFLGKDLGDDFRALVNLEWNNNYDTKSDVGAARLEEAWVSWQPRDEFRLRLGKHIPTFNAFNTIKNKMPLHPFILRPLIYEASISTKYLDLSSWAPKSAFASVDGVVEISDDMTFDYSVFLGGSDFTENAFSGQDTIVGKSVGARIGIEHSDLGIKAGVTGTLDYERFTELRTMVDEVYAGTVSGSGYKNSAEVKAFLTELDGNLVQVEGGLAQVADGIAQLDGGISQVNDGVAQLDAGLAQLEQAKSALTAEEYATQKGTLEAQKAGALEQKAGFESQKTGAEAQGAELEVLKAEIEAGQAQLIPVRNFFTEFEKGFPIASRYRLGADFSYEPEFGTVFKTEYVYVGYTGDDVDQINALNESMVKVGAQSAMGTTENRQFLSVMLGQKFLEDYLVYGLYSRMTNGLFIPAMERGLSSYGGGINYSPIFNVTLKAQFSAYGIQKKSGFDMEHVDDERLYNYYFGTSVFF